MMVGPSGSGKTTSRIVLLRAMERAFGIQIKEHRLDAKAMSKDELYGVLDPTNREWTDGVFTRLLRDIQGAFVFCFVSTMACLHVFSPSVCLLASLFAPLDACLNRQPLFPGEGFVCRRKTAGLLNMWKVVFI